MCLFRGLYGLLYFGSVWGCPTLLGQSFFFFSNNLNKEVLPFVKRHSTQCPVLYFGFFFSFSRFVTVYKTRARTEDLGRLRGSLPSDWTSGKVC